MKRILWSAILSFPLAFGMTAAGDSAAVTNSFRCLFSPGLVLAAHLVTAPNKHLGIGALLDVADWYARTGGYGLLLNWLFYGLIMFTAMEFSARRQSVE
ncbi:MAG TPA: hypothetical protein VFI72_04525 [Candidatus Angelobacter sp.]|nr:hypothetical protein [Candidatus Angelobacter sp.]